MYQGQLLGSKVVPKAYCSKACHNNQAYREVDDNNSHHGRNKACGEEVFHMGDLGVFQLNEKLNCLLVVWYKGKV